MELVLASLYCWRGYGVSDGLLTLQERMEPLLQVRASDA
jgi:hypothetical protein